MNHHPPDIQHTQEPRVVRYDALAAADAVGLELSPASLLIAPPHPPTRPTTHNHPVHHLLAIGTPDEINAHPAASNARWVRLPGSVLIPGLVNAHTHLDLTHVGPMPHDPDEGFVAWAEKAITRRAVSDDDIARSVRLGVELSLAGGTVAVGDIAGAVGGLASLTAWRALRESPLMGVSFIEFFAPGSKAREKQRQIADLLDEHRAEIDAARHGPIRVGLQPHAPYSVDLAGYAWAVRIAREYRLALCTHLAETPEEHEFIADGTGPQRELLEQMGMWGGMWGGGMGGGDAWRDRSWREPGGAHRRRAEPGGVPGRPCQRRRRPGD